MQTPQIIEPQHGAFETFSRCSLRFLDGLSNNFSTLLVAF
jgi:hypothetical protein